MIVQLPALTVAAVLRVTTAGLAKVLVKLSLTWTLVAGTVPVFFTTMLYGTSKANALTCTTVPSALAASIFCGTKLTGVAPGVSPAAGVLPLLELSLANGEPVGTPPAPGALEYTPAVAVLFCEVPGIAPAFG